MSRKQPIWMVFDPPRRVVCRTPSATLARLLRVSALGQTLALLSTALGVVSCKNDAPARQQASEREAQLYDQAARQEEERARRGKDEVLVRELTAACSNRAAWARKVARGERWMVENPKASREAKAYEAQALDDARRFAALEEGAVARALVGVQARRDELDAERKRTDAELHRVGAGPAASTLRLRLTGIDGVLAEMDKATASCRAPATE